ncbi:hypothetical protein QTP88_009956 [Uroleucon formosanum]
MTGDIFSDWLKEWDKQLAKEKRHILLTVDNCPAHPPVQTENIKLVFLPPNTISVLQPMDQGIIKALKVKFQKKLVLKIINQEKQGKDIKISVLDAILMISDAWNDVSTTTIRNCFHHAGFKASLNDETEIVSENNLDTECFSEENIQSFAEVDDALLTDEEPTEEEIVKSILNTNNVESNEQADEESEEIVFKEPSISEMHFYIDQKIVGKDMKTYLLIKVLAKNKLFQMSPVQGGAVKMAAEASRKRKMKENHSPKSPTSPQLKIKNRYTPLSNFDDNVEINDNTLADIDNVYSEVRKIPPIFVHNITNYEQFHLSLASVANDDFTIEQKKDSLKLKLTTIDDYRTVTKELQ